MQIKRNVELPNFERTRNGIIENPYVAELYSFYDSEDVSLLFECEDKKEATRIRSTISGRIKSDKLALNAFLRGTGVYVTRKAGE